jgi:NADH dehydrogenase
VLIVPAPLFVHRLLARVFEMAMRVPLVARAQVRILEEGVVEAAGGAAVAPPDDLAPRRRFTDTQIRGGLPERGGFTFRDLRCYATVPR